MAGADEPTTEEEILRAAQVSQGLTIAALETKVAALAAEMSLLQLRMRTLRDELQELKKVRP